MTSISRRLQGYLARKAQEHAGKDDKGFTLIELAIVIAVIAILIAVALPTFLGVQAKAHDSAAEQNIVNSLISAKTYYATNNSSYTGIAAAIGALEPSLQYDTGAAGVGPSAGSTLKSTNAVSVIANTEVPSESVGFAAWTGGSNNNCLFAIDVASGSSSAVVPATGITGAGTWWNTGAPVSGLCVAVAVPVSGSTGWSETIPS